MRQKVMEERRVIPVTDEVDVLVIGSGPAGFSAAVTAAREGMNTMLIEQAGDVGGIATVGLMSHWTGNTEGGIYEEILQRSSDTKNTDRESKKIINPERLKTVMLEMLAECGVKLKLYTFASDPIMEDGKIKGVILQNKTGRTAVEAKIVIDASGDGDIAEKAGVPYTKGREGDGKMQPVSIMFKVAGVDMERGVFPSGFEEDFTMPYGSLQEKGKEILPSPAGHVLLYKSTLPGVVTCNMTNCTDIDGTKTEDLTKATYLCRKQMDAIVEFLREYVPGFEECYLISSASLIGVRETRHFAGEYTLNEEDILEARVFDDWVVTKAHFNFDIHNLTGSGLDADGAQQKFPQVKGYTIPYRCFVPLKVENLYLAGRNISGTHKAHSNYRVMPICANMGLAVGVAAALCVKEDTTPRMLSAELIQKRLMELGVRP